MHKRCVGFSPINNHQSLNSPGDEPIQHRADELLREAAVELGVLHEQSVPERTEQQVAHHIEIGVRPSYPAEFIIVRIGIWAGGSDVSET